MQGRERGITITGFLFFTAIFVYGIVLGIQLLPIYMQNYNIEKALDLLAEQTPNAFSGNFAEDSERLKNKFMSQLSIDGIETIKRDDLKIRATNEGYALSLVYDRRFQLVANVDAVVHFDLKKTVGRRAQ